MLRLVDSTVKRRKLVTNLLVRLHLPGLLINYLLTMYAIFLNNLRQCIFSENSLVIKLLILHLIQRTAIEINVEITPAPNP